MSICVLGLGYVGLTLAVTLAKFSNPIYGIEIDKNKVTTLSQGLPPIYEPGLGNLLMEVIQKNSLKLNNKLTKEIADLVDTYIICIGTPIDDHTKKPIFTYLDKIIKEIASFLKKGDLVIVRSTVTVGTTKNRIKKTLEELSHLKFGRDFYLCSAPERTVEGKALQELLQLPQIVGSDDEKSIDKTANIFNKITKTVIRIPSFDAAEVIKLFDNTSRDVNIALANQFGLICEKLGLASKEIIEAANFGYSRNRIFIAGAGVGGQCLVKDPYFLIDSVNEKLDVSLIRKAREINDSMPQHVISLIESIFKEMNKKISNSRILVLGFAFKGKPETDDMRYSPTLPILEYLKNKSVDVVGYDPMVPQEKIKNLGIKFEEPELIENVDCILIMNNNSKYLEIDFKKIKQNSKEPVGIMDGWQLLDVSYIKDLGFIYRGVGMVNN